VRLESGYAGGLVMIALAAVISLGFAAFGAYAALRTGSTEAVNGIFPVFFVFLFISSINLPRDLMATDWFRWLATVNPVSYLIEGMRSLIITGWDAEALALAFGIGIAIVVVGFALAVSALPERMART
jgi:ABC-2 type transport system permease protein